MKGWVRVYRSLLEHARFRDPHWLSVWTFLLLNATHQSHKMNFDGKVVVLQPGQLISGRLAIAAATGVHPSKVKRILAMMKSDQQIDQQAGAKGSIFTVRNWRAYQKVDQQNGQQATSDRPATDQRLTTNKNGKNEENVSTEMEYAKTKTLQTIDTKQNRATLDGEDVQNVQTYAEGFKRSFDVTFDGKQGEAQYIVKKSDLSALGRWRKEYPNVTPEKLAATAKACWEGKFIHPASLSIAGMCSKWAELVAQSKHNSGHATTAERPKLTYGWGKK